jgi:hypothetical protein
VICPAEVMLAISRQPNAKSCSGPRTANGVADRVARDTDVFDAVEIEGKGSGVVAGPSFVSAATSFRF